TGRARRCGTCSPIDGTSIATASRWAAGPKRSAPARRARLVPVRLFDEIRRLFHRTSGHRLSEQVSVAEPGHGIPKRQAVVVPGQGKGGNLGAFHLHAPLAFKV